MKRNSIEMISQIEIFLGNLDRSYRVPRVSPTLYSVRAIADAAAVSEQTVRRWLRGEQKPTPANWHLLRHAAYGRTLPASWTDFRFMGDSLWFGDGAYTVTAEDVRRWLWRL